VIVILRFIFPKLILSIHLNDRGRLSHNLYKHGIFAELISMNCHFNFNLFNGLYIGSKNLKKDNYRGKIKIRFFGLGIEIKIKEKSASSVQD
jgi:hypothetical protein